ncbi:uncharacterized protein O9250_010200 [Rhynochetos jubatus]
MRRAAALAQAASGKHWVLTCVYGPLLNGSGLDVTRMDFMDSGCAMRKTVARRNSKLEDKSGKFDLVIWEIEVPKDLVGQLIGKRGRFMNFLRQSSGAKIYVSTLPYFRDSQVCHIEGSAHQVETVLSLIGKKFKELCLTNIYGLPPPTLLTLHSILMTAWLLLPDGVTVEVVVAHQVDAGHMFLHQHTHPTFHVLRSLDQQMYACYSHPAVPTLPTPVEVGIICAAPGLDGAWLRAQVISYFEETDEVELRYVDYGGYDKVKIDTLRQIRSDFLSLPFQGAEVLLDNVVPLPVALEMCAVLVSKAALLGGRLYPYCLGRRGFRLRRRRGVSSRTRPPNSSATYVHGNSASGFGKHFPLSLQQPSGHNTCVTSSLTDGFQQLPTATVGEDHFSSEADAAVAEMSRGAVLAAQSEPKPEPVGLAAGQGSCGEMLVLRPPLCSVSTARGCVAGKGRAVPLVADAGREEGHRNGFTEHKVASCPVDHVFTWVCAALPVSAVFATPVPGVWPLAGQREKRGFWQCPRGFCVQCLTSGKRR